MCLIKIPFEFFVCYFSRRRVTFMLFFEWSGNFYANKRKSMGQPRHLDPRVVQHAG